MQRVDQQNDNGIGDTPSGTGTLKPTDDVGSGGSADIGGQGDIASTGDIRTGNIGKGGILGTRLGNVGPRTGLDTGATEAMTGAVGAGEPPRGTGQIRHDRVEGPDLVDESRAGQGSAVGTSKAALGAAGVPSSEQLQESGDTGLGDLGAAAQKDLGAGLGATRGDDRDVERTPGEISGVGGTRGSGKGTGHLEGGRSSKK